MQKGLLIAIALLMSGLLYCQTGSKRETVYPVKIQYQGKVLVAFTEPQVEALVDLKDDYETAMAEISLYDNRLMQADLVVSTLKIEVDELRSSNRQLTGVIALDTELLRAKTEANEKLRKKLRIGKTVRDVALIAAAVELLIILIK